VYTWRIKAKRASFGELTRFYLHIGDRPMGDLPQYITLPVSFEAPKRFSVASCVILCCACLLSPDRLLAKRWPASIVVVKGWRRAAKIDRFLARAERRLFGAFFVARQKSHHNVARRNPLDRNRHKRLNIGGKGPFPLNCRSIPLIVSKSGLRGLSPSYKVGIRCS
jgi:hypothetical protein